MDPGSIYRTLKRWIFNREMPEIKRIPEYCFVTIWKGDICPKIRNAKSISKPCRWIGSIATSFITGLSLTRLFIFRTSVWRYLRLRGSSHRISTAYPYWEQSLLNGLKARKKISGSSNSRQLELSQLQTNLPCWRSTTALMDGCWISKLVCLLQRRLTLWSSLSSIFLGDCAKPLDPLGRAWFGMILSPKMAICSGKMLWPIWTSLSSMHAMAYSSTINGISPLYRALLNLQALVLAMSMLASMSLAEALSVEESSSLTEHLLKLRKLELLVGYLHPHGRSNWPPLKMISGSETPNFGTARRISKSNWTRISGILWNPEVKAGK